MQLQHAQQFAWIIFISIASLNGLSIKSKTMESSNALFVEMKNLRKLFEKLGRRRHNINNNSITKKWGNNITTTVTDANWRRSNLVKQFTNVFNAKMSSFAKLVSNLAVIFATASSAKQQHKKNGDNVKIEKVKKRSIASKD